MEPPGNTCWVTSTPRDAPHLPDQRIHNQVMDLEDIEYYCSGASLSPGVLRKKLSHLTANQIGGSPLLHELCLNKNVTLELVEAILDSGPHAAHVRVKYNNGIDDQRVEAYPIHVACANRHCPGSIVRLLAENNPTALGHMSVLKYNEIVFDGECIEALPLHYYLRRKSNVDLDTVKILIGLHPAGECFPIHLLMEDLEEVCDCNTTYWDIIQHMINANPSNLKCTSGSDQVLLHLACYSAHMTATIIQSLINGWPESTRQRDCEEYLPIHHLCQNQKLNETAKLEIVKILVDADPDSLNDRSNDSGLLPIHMAAKYQSLAFAKILVDAHPCSLREKDRNGNLPCYLACESGSIDTIKYLFNADPQSIYSTNICGFNPLHFVISERGKHLTTRDRPHETEVVRCLLEIDPKSASRQASLEVQPFMIYGGYLSLHFACENRANIDIVKLLFNAYPQAINKNVRGASDLQWRNPPQIARVSGHMEAAIFLEQQLHEFAALVGGNRGTPIHDALQNNATLGVIKLLLDRCTGGISALDANKNSPLHVACHLGRCDVVIHLMGLKMALVLEPNGGGKLPLELLLGASHKRDGLEYTEAVWRLLVAYPMVLFARPSRPANP